MLKKIRVLFLGLVVLAGSACVTPTHASSAFPEILITYVQAGGSTGAKEELVVLYNNSDEPTDLTDYCLINKSSIEFACLSAGQSTGGVVRYILPARGYVTFASRDYVSAHALPDAWFGLVYMVTNQSSGSIVGGSDTLKFAKGTGESVASYGWATSLASGKAWQRKTATGDGAVLSYANTNTTQDWALTDAVIPVESSLIEELTVVEAEPEDPVVDGAEGEVGKGESVPNSPRLLPILTEVLPNPSGADAGLEFIELYNPYEQSIVLEGLKIRIGFDTAKWFAFPGDALLAPGEYAAFYNGASEFTLTNTASRLELYVATGDGDVASGVTVEYESAKDDMAWALIEGNWQYTNVPTPGSKNLPSDEDEDGAAVLTVATQKPCATNQFRNPETGRCKLLVASTTSPAPCKVGQYRSPETNRCRSITASSSEPAPCKTGQERNPETNRCRNIKSMSDVGYEVQGVQTVADNQPRWYYWAAMALVIVLLLGYAVWEWRVELLGLWRRFVGLFGRKTGIY